MGKGGYRTFIRTCKSFEQFSKAKKRVQDTGLTADEAQRACNEYNKNRTPAEIARGTKMEFESM